MHEVKTGAKSSQDYLPDDTTTLCMSDGDTTTGSLKQRPRRRVIGQLKATLYVEQTKWHDALTEHH